MMTRSVSSRARVMTKPLDFVYDDKTGWGCASATLVFSGSCFDETGLFYRARVMTRPLDFVYNDEIDRSISYMMTRSVSYRARVMTRPLDFVYDDEIGVLSGSCDDARFRPSDLRPFGLTPKSEGIPIGSDATASRRLTPHG
ncbi:unnamed protein product [Microthlaspi erraticum]|uniref:Uncharacterized protein n=1 Tax=Microthlaspi erraticum TaxID=1685480 RepID=A0A6D2IK35_9BRAS|nr:unnamed protein product [Microthlaspi erraticum]